MKKSHLKNILKNIVCVIAALLILQSCKVKNNDSDEPENNDIIEVITNIMDFQSVDTIPSGWTTFKYINKSNEPHFFLLEKYPENKFLEDGQKEIFPVFQKGMDLINNGNSEEGFAAFSELPAWYPQIVFKGGSGLVSPKKTSLTTIKMEPGYYVMECYVKMANGTFHSVMGMEKQLIVTDENNNNPEPKADINVTLSSTKGYIIDKPIQKGNQTISVYFEDQIVHENFVGHDLNLMKIEKGVILENIENWMNWANPKGLISPAPQGITFLGGVNDMPAGSLAFLTITLDPGKYAFVAEVPNTLSKNMLVPFIVAE